jgi:hypothetical protein
MKSSRMSCGLALLVAVVVFSAGVTMADQGNISGLILNANGLSPVADLLVVLENGSGVHSTTTDENGLYLLEDIAPGNYQIQVSGSKYLTLLREVTLGPNETIIVNFAAISGDIADINPSGIQYPAEDAAAAQTWKGRWRETKPNAGLTGAMILAARVSGGTINGTMTVRGTNNGTLKFPCTGTISGRTVLLQGKIGQTKFVAKGTLSSSRTKLTGTYDVYNRQKRTGHGTYVLNKQ